MGKYTIGSLIKLLKEFPEDLEISNEISLYWFYPNDLKTDINELSKKDYERLTRNKATDVCIFEGSWEKDTIIDSEDMMTQLLDKYYENKEN